MYKLVNRVHQITISVASLLCLVFLFESCKEGGDEPAPGYDFPEGKVMFDIPPLDISGVIIFEPMGSLDVFPKEHGGFHHKQTGMFEPTIPIYALADGQIQGLGKSGKDNWINIKYSTTISVRLGHVGDFEDFIIEQTGPLVEGEPQYINIDVKKGQIIARVSAFSALDIGLHDQGGEKSFIYPELFWFETLYASDIFEYFNEPIKSELKATSVREVEPLGGKVDYDVQGTLAGNWFIPGTPEADPYANHFAIAYDHFYPHRIGISDGYARYAENIQTWSRSWVKNNGPLPETVNVAHGIVKYELIQGRWLNQIDSENWELMDLTGVDDQMPWGVYLFEMLETEKMQAEFFPDKTPDEVMNFSGNQRIYVRNP